uniref:DAGKc domain-containing protein n=1 Tax=Glycine max TaxID=3847 RepID=A0A0R0K8B2_SOYBN
MDSPSSSTTGDTSKVPIKSSSSIVESLRGCGISSGTHVDKEELRKNLTMPKYLRFAMRDSIMFKDPTAGENLCIRSKDDHKAVAPSTPMIVFINPRSGGRHGPFLKERLQHLMSEEQVLDMLDVKPHEFLQYGLGCLEMLTGLGDSCAKETRKRIRIMGGSFPFSWKAAIKRTLYKASIGPICRLDSWRLSLSMPEGTIIEPPHSLKHTIEFTLDEEWMPKWLMVFIIYGMKNLILHKVQLQIRLYTLVTPVLKDGSSHHALVIQVLGDLRIFCECMSKSSIAQNGSRFQFLQV